MFDVAFIQSYFNTVRIAEPIGICYLAAQLRKHGFSVKILEPCVDGWSVEEAAGQILKTPMRILGVSLHRDRNKEEVLSLLKTIRPRMKDTLILVGGHGPSLGIAAEHLYETVYTRLKYEELGAFVDGFVIGEADNSLMEIVEKVTRGEDWTSCPGVATLSDTGTFRINPPPPKITDLDSLPFMTRDCLELYIEKYQRPIAASISLGRGCNYSCAFCTVLTFGMLQHGPRHRQRSIDNVIEEIDHLHSRYGITHFNFEDDNFIIQSGRGVEKICRFCEAVIELPYSITFSMSCRADVVDEYLFRRLKEAGLINVFVGLESIHEEDLALFRKRMRAKDVCNALDALISLGYSCQVGSRLRITIGYILWNPFSTIQKLRESLEFLRRYNISPKQLRTILRLYTSSRLKSCLGELGLLDDGEPDGWRYRDGHLRLRKIQNCCDDYVRSVVEVRDKIRTIEKAVDRYYESDIPIRSLREFREELDEGCFRYVKTLLDIADRAGTSGFEEQVDEYDHLSRESLSIEIQKVRNGIDDSLGALQLPEASVDLFRK